MKPIRTIRTGACVLAAACALAACTQPGPYGARGAPPAPPPHPPAPGTTMPDANTRYETRPSPGNTLPPGATGGDPADVPPPAERHAGRPDATGHAAAAAVLKHPRPVRGGTVRETRAQNLPTACKSGPRRAARRGTNPRDPRRGAFGPVGMEAASILTEYETKP